MTVGQVKNLFLGIVKCVQTFKGLHQKKIKKNFQKPIDKLIKVCYNSTRKREGNSQKRGVITMKDHVAFNLTTGVLITTTGTGNFLKRLVRKAGKGEWIFTHSTFEGMMAKYSAMISR